MSDHLRRHLAPMSDDAWAAVDAEAHRTLSHFLAGRALVDVDGPLGWEHSARTTGRIEALGHLAGDVGTGRRQVQPFIELRSTFTLPMAEVDVVDRGAKDPDLSSVISAARRAALAEDTALFNGWSEGAMRGIAEASTHPAIDIGDDYGEYAGYVARGVAELRRAGIGGPYALALGSRCYTGVIETTAHGGYPVLEHIRLILGGSIMWAPDVDGAIVISMRGGDYVLTLGQDWSIGYRDHTTDRVELYLEESFDFHVREPAAAAVLRYP